MELARVVLSIVLAVLLVFTGGGKLLALPYAHTNRERLAVNPVLWRVIGCLELAAVVGLVWGIWFVPFSIAASFGVALLMVGALTFRIRTHNGTVILTGLADLVVLALAVVLIVLSFETLPVLVTGGLSK